LPAGSYVLTVAGAAAQTGTYSFDLTAVPDPQTFPINIGDTVSDGVPSTGAGNIESPGATDRYTFTVGPGGSRIYQHAFTDNCRCTWSLRSTTGSLQPGYPAPSPSTALPRSLPAGSYVLTVAGGAAQAGTYSFDLAAVPDPQT